MLCNAYMIVYMGILCAPVPGTESCTLSAPRHFTTTFRNTHKDDRLIDITWGNKPRNIQM